MEKIEPPIPIQGNTSLKPERRFVAGQGREPRGTLSFQRGDLIFGPDEGHGAIYIVRSGCVRVYKVLANGRSVNLGLLGPNTVFTQEETNESFASGSYATALVDSRVSTIGLSDLADLIASSPELAASIVAGVSHRLTELQTLIEHLLLRDTSIRLVATLLSLGNRFGNPHEGAFTIISLPLSRRDLAEMIGSNRVTVSRKLIDLEQQGLVRSLGRNSIAVDLKGLRTYAGRVHSTPAPRSK